MQLPESPLALSGRILQLAFPLIFINVGIMIMQFIDALFLAWYSPEAIAAVVPAGMASFLLVSACIGTAGYTGTFVAHYMGSGQQEQMHHALWQGIYVALASSVIVAAIGFFARPLMSLAGHAPAVIELEAQFFEIMCWGSVFGIVSSALSGYYSGQSRTRILMATQLCGIAINIVLDYVLIFGHWGFPRMGIRGAAIATIAGQLATCLLLCVVYIIGIDKTVVLKRIVAFNQSMMLRLLKFGLPSGIRFAFEMLAWTLFLFIVGRIGTQEQAASNIVFRINGFAFFPIIGIAQAVAIMVGQAQGSRDSRLSFRITVTGMVLAESWMVLAAIAFFVVPNVLLNMFTGNSDVATSMVMTHIGVVLLRFVAIYCLLDAFNIVMVSVLQAAGDTRFTMIVSIVAHGVLLSALFIVDHFHGGLYVEWLIATVFVVVTALIWLWRFSRGAWRTMEVVEAQVFEGEPAAAP